MTCSSCQQKVQGLLSGIPGIKNVSIDLSSGKAEIEMDKHISTTALQAALKDYPKYQLSESLEIPAAKVYSEMEEPAKSWLATYRPLLLVFGYIVVLSLIGAGATTHFNVWAFMRVFMAGFFIAFSFFKMLDLNGFADSYSMYDIVAKKIRLWGYVYPFVELALGLSFVINFQPLIMNEITLVVMSVSIIGVLQSVFNKRKIKCACLGSVFNLPMSTVTIIEDSIMIAMSITMIFKML
ncbi:MAG: heavy metal transporter [Sediminibacterium sp.]|nr:heavy metal transporter [Sediminibacterium sp.]